MQPDRSIFFVKWAQAFVDFIHGKKLRDRSADDIRSFLKNLRHRPGIEEWQVQQVEHSLKGEGEDAIQRAVRNAALLSGGSKKVSCHTMRHSLSSRLLETGYDIFALQGLLGHADVFAAAVYTHVLDKQGISVKSPMDF